MQTKLKHRLILWLALFSLAVVVLVSHSSGTPAIRENEKTYIVDQTGERWDITQAVFVAIMQAAPRYRPRGKLSTWIYRIVVNRCLNLRDSAAVRLRAKGGEAALVSLPADDDQQPDRLLERAERARRLQAAILALPQRQRLALILNRFEGLSYQQVAQVLGCSRKSVESLLVRAKRGLLRNLDH